MATPKPATAATANTADAAASQSGASASTNQRPVQVKLVLLGEAAVGKSSLVTRFVQNDFHENAQPTIGAAFLTQKCRLEDRVIKFEIWDTAGQERFHSLAPMYYRNAAASIVVYDITNAKTLEKAKSWVKELQRQANPNIVIALVGNKLDLVSPSPSSTDPTTPTSSADDEADDATATPAAPTAASGGDDARQVAKEEAQAYATENGLLFSETSAKTGDGIVELFTDIAKKIPIAEMLGSGPRGARTAQGAAGRTEGTVNVGEQGAQGAKEGCAC